MTEPSTTPIEILLIEDNPGDVRLVREALADAGVAYRLHSVDNGAAALDYLYRGAGTAPAGPDLILLDLNLPGQSGHDILREIKGDPRLKQIPVAILSSSTAETDIRDSYAAHANCYISKPVDFDGYTDTFRTVRSFWFETARLPGRQY